MPKKVASIVPIGNDFPGFLKSPLNPTPAVIPVKAGKQMAKTVKKDSRFENPKLLLKCSPATVSDVPSPRKNNKIDNNRIPATT